MILTKSMSSLLGLVASSGEVTDVNQPNKCFWASTHYVTL